MGNVFLFSAQAEASIPPVTPGASACIRWLVNELVLVRAGRLMSGGIPAQITAAHSKRDQHTHTCCLKEKDTHTSHQ